MLISLLIYAGIVPLAGAIAAALVCRVLSLSPRATWAWSVTAGLLSAQIGWKSRAGFALAVRAFTQPAVAADWLPMILLVTLGISLLLIIARPTRPGQLIAVAAIFCVVVPVRLLSGNVEVGEWSAVNKIAHLFVLAAVFGVPWSLLASKGAERSFFGRALAMVIVASVAAVVLTQSGVLVYGFACGAVAASVGGVALVDIALGDAASAGKPLTFRGFPGAAGPITFSLVSLIILGLFFANLSTLNAVLLSAALAVAGSPLPRALTHQPLWLQLAARALFCFIPLAIALITVLD